MNAYWRRPLNFPWPPFIYALAVIAAILLGSLVPLPEPALSARTTLVAGAGLVIVALCLDVWALTTLFRARTTVMPHRSSAHLVTSGPFRFSRNPIYLGYTLMTLGLGFIFDNSWLFVAAFVAATLTHLIAIRAEERHLIARFGIEFERYCRRTRAWV